MSLVVVSGCQTATFGPVSTPIRTSQPTETTWPTSTLGSPPIRPTRTPIVEFTDTFTRTPWPTQTPRSTLVSALEPDEIQTFLLEMLETNGGCELPCWWGIIPGETAWEDMLAFFDAQSLWVSEHKADGSMYAWLDLSRYLDWESEIVFQEQHGRVQSIRVEGYVTEGLNPSQMPLNFLNEHLAQFGLSNVFSMYGVPSQVYVGGMGVHGPSQGVYDLWIEYADLGILIGYSGYTVGDYVEYFICPVGNGVQKIELRLLPPGSILEDVENLTYTWDLTELPNLTVIEFYEAFNAPEFPECLRVLESGHYKALLPPDLPPFLTVEEDAQLVEMLETNEHCQLPCWWGITPGVTSVQDALDTFLSYGKPVGVYHWSAAVGTQYEVGLFGSHGSLPLDYVVSHKFFEDKGVVSYLCADGRAPVWTYSRHLSQDWHRYSLGAILTHLGRPSRVSVSYEHVDCGDTYALGLVYDELGVLIQYTGIVQREDGIVKICPNMGNTTRFLVFLADPTSASDIEPAFLRSCGYVAMDGISLEDSGMNSGTFYNTYVDPNSSACLELPELDYWTCP